jgi:hypothetical protein
MWYEGVPKSFHSHFSPTTELSVQVYRHVLLFYTSPCLSTHFVQGSTSNLMPTEYNCLGSVQSQPCSTSFTSSSPANRWPQRALFRSPDRWKSEDVRSRLYVGLLKTSNFSSQKVSLVWKAVWHWALSCKTKKLLIIFLIILCEGVASVHITPCWNTLYLILWFHIPGNGESLRTMEALTSHLMAES